MNLFLGSVGCVFSGVRGEFTIFGFDCVSVIMDLTCLQNEE
ncbi:Putative uncharacterized protein [Moritella viscosa]|uniref:Uncharacterized protein n=1 Tax=Moritella viscosa TaxID=80854 RepID=A0ABY1HJ40_9GAMM|nr:Putative uncharacterized protein [Moritella viscosa]